MKTVNCFIPAPMVAQLPLPLVQKPLPAQSSNPDNDPVQLRPGYTYQDHHQYTDPYQPYNSQWRSRHRSNVQGQRDFCRSTHCPLECLYGNILPDCLLFPRPPYQFIGNWCQIICKVKHLGIVNLAALSPHEQARGANP